MSIVNQARVIFAKKIEIKKLIFQITLDKEKLRGHHGVLFTSKIDIIICVGKLV